MNASRLARLFLLSTLLLALFAFGGCSDDDFTEPVTEVIPPIQPDSTDVLMQYFESLYTGMDLGVLEDILHDDFQLLLSHDTIEDWGLASGAILEKAQMMEIHGNMFGSIIGMDDNGNQIQPLDRIEFSLFERITNWEQIQPEDPVFPGTQRAMYTMRVFFHDNSGGHAFEVNQSLQFYAQQEGEFWYLKGIRSVPGKAIERTGYDKVLYMYNTIPE